MVLMDCQVIIMSADFYYVASINLLYLKAQKSSLQPGESQTIEVQLRVLLLEVVNSVLICRGLLFKGLLYLV
jgi:hypothetical protein